MNRQEYMAELAKYLRKLPADDYQDALNYFEEGFDAVGPEGEAERIRELGEPRDAAWDILSKLLKEDLDAHEQSNEQSNEQTINHNMAGEANYSTKNLKKNKKLKWILIALLCIMAAPVGIPVVIMFFSILLVAVILFFTFFLVLLSLGVALFAVTGKLFWYGLLSIGSATVPEILLIVGLGLCGLGLAILLVNLLFKFCRWSVYRLKRFCINFMSKVRRKIL